VVSSSLGCKYSSWVEVANTLVDYIMANITGVKRFYIVLNPGACIIKRFTAIINFTPKCLSLSVTSILVSNFVIILVSYFQIIPSLIFAILGIFAN
jgi:hypothetical protein